MFEDGDRAAVTQFTDERVPVSLGVLLDASDSMRGQPMVDAGAAVEHFVGDLLKDEDEAFIGLVQPSAAAGVGVDAPALVAEAPARDRDGRPAARRSTMRWCSRRELFDRRSRPRAALVVISDGADTASDRTLQQARDAVVRRDAFVYAMAIDAPGAARQHAREPRRAARPHRRRPAATPKWCARRRISDRPPQRIAEELNSQYTIGYTPVAAARRHLARHPRAHQGPALPGSRAPGLRGGAQQPSIVGTWGQVSDLPDLDVFRSRARSDRPPPLVAARTAVGDDAVVARPAVRALARGRAAAAAAHPGRLRRRSIRRVGVAGHRAVHDDGTSRRAGCRRCRGCRRFPS